VTSPSGRSGRAALRIAIAVLALLGALPAGAQKKPKPDKPDKNDKADDAKPAAAPTAAQKSKTYSFGGLDIDGRLKTPQLLYFLNRMKSEFDTTAPERRSFLPELKRSTDEM
jgi:hypothetical protein